MSDSTVLIIGTPGPLAFQLAAGLAARGERVELLLAPGQNPTPTDAVALRGLVDSGQAVVLRGDPAAMDFGLSGADYRELVARTRRVLCATLADPLWTGDVERCRAVRAAAEVLEFVRSGGGASGLLFLSSLLVFGGARASVVESDLSLGQSFSGLFEESLAVAERVIRHATSKTKVSVLRVAPIVGDLESGRLQEDSALCELSRRVERAPRSSETVFSDLPIRFDTTERVARALLELWKQDEPMTAHLVDYNAPTDRQLLDWLGDHWDRRFPEAPPGSRGRRAKSLFDGLSSPERRAFRGWPLVFARGTAERVFPELLDRPFTSVLEQLLRHRESGLPPSSPSA